MMGLGSSRALRWAACAVALGCWACDAAATIWQNDWTLSAPPSITNFYYHVAFSQDGDLLFVTDQENTPDSYFDGVDTQVVRSTAAGAARWTVNIPYSYYFAAAGVIPYADGSAVITMVDASDPQLSPMHFTRVDASGHLAWHLPFGWAVPVDAQALAAATCNTIARVDLATGQTQWVYAGATWTRSFCAFSGFRADNQGNIYAAFATSPYVGAVSSIVKLDAFGHVAWTVEDANGLDGHLVGAAAGNVYFQSGETLRAYRVGDGSLAWSLENTRFWFPLGSPAEPIVASAGSMSRLDPATGTTRWSRPLASYAFAGTVDDDIVIGANTGAAFTLSRINGGDGSTGWSSTLPNQQFFGIGSCGTGTLCVAAREDRAFSVQHVDAASGSLLDIAAPPAVPLAVDGASFREDANHIVAAGTVQGPDGPQLVVRRLDASTGTELWHTTPTAASISNTVPGVTNTQGAIVVSLASNNSAYRANYGRVWIGALDDASGGLRWEHEFYDLYQATTDVSAPIADTHGDIYVAYAATLMCQPPYGTPHACVKRFVVKLSGTDGTEQWRFDTSRSDSSSLYPSAPSITMLGNDVLVSAYQGISSGSPTGSPSAGSARISGSDGSVLWASPLFAEFGAFLTVADNGAVLALGTIDAGSANAGQPAWARLDPDTGATLWLNNTPSLTCTTNVNNCTLGFAFLTLANGDLFLGGEINSHAFAQLRPATAGAQAQNFPLTPASSSLHSYVRGAAVDANGSLWVELYTTRSSTEYSGVASVAKFDTATGALADQQVIGAYFDDALIDSRYLRLLAAPDDNNRVLVEASISGSLAPSTLGNAEIDLSVQAHGDLAVSARIDRRAVAAGAFVGFHIVATYTGDVPADGSTVFAKLPWPVDLQSLACNGVGATSCSVDARSGNLRATANLQPGGSIDISGRMRALPGAESSTLSAFAHGAPGLVEQDVENNFAAAMIAESLFADGFGD